MTLLLILVLVAVASVALAAWALDRTRPNSDACDCTRCAEKRANVIADWEREYIRMQDRGEAE